MKPEKAEYANTTFRASYKNPSCHDRPNFRTRRSAREGLFDNTASLSVKLNSSNLMTGYESNRQLWDGTTWRTEANQHTD